MAISQPEEALPPSHSSELSPLLVRVTGRSGVQGQGPFLYMDVEFDGSTIRDAQYETYGCPTAMRCGHWITVWMKGRTLEAVGVIEPNDLIQVLGGVPLGKEHCAELAVGALRDAVQQLQGDSSPSKEESVFHAD